MRRQLAKKSTANQSKEHNAEKYIHWLQLHHYLHSFSCRCFPNLQKSREILRKFEHIAVQGHPRSSISVPIKSIYATSVINRNYGCISYCFPRYWRILLINSLFSTPHPCLMPPSKGTPYNINVIYTLLKSTFSGLQFRPDNMGLIFIRLATVAFQICDITWNFEKIMT